MKIVDIEFFQIDMPLAVPYTIAYETISQTSNVILKLITDTGLIGWGCAAPDKEVTGETAGEVIESIKTTIIPIVKNESPFRHELICKLMKQQIPKSKSAMAMVDIALYDLLARKADLPLYELLGGYRDSIGTSITIGILPLKETLAQAQQFFSDGFTIIKLKGGSNLEEDIEKVLKLREQFGIDFELRFDANQGYSIEDSVKFIDQTRSAKIELFEQPSNQNKEARLGQITQQVHVPVMADESIKSLTDVFRLASNDVIDMVNIKIMKVGGILESQHISSVAKAAGMEVMIGCLDECSLGISAGLHFALSRPNIHYADLDGHLDLLNDPFKNLFTLRNGMLFPNKTAGLGNINLN